MFTLLKKAREQIYGETQALLHLREAKKDSRRERIRAKERGMETTANFTTNVIRAWKEAGVDVDIEREIATLEEYGGGKAEAG